MCSRMFPEESDEFEKSVPLLTVRLKTKESLMTTQETTRINNNPSRSRMLPGPTLLGLVRRKCTENLNLCALNATTIMGRPSDPQPTPSPPYPSEDNIEPQSDPSPRPSPPTHILDSIPKVSGGNQGAKVGRKENLKANWMQKESVSKQGRKSAKAEPSVYKNPLFDELPDDTMDYMDTEDAQDVGRTRNGVNEEKEGTEDAVSTEDVVSTDKEKVSTDRSKVSTNRSRDSTDKEKESTDKEKEGTDKEKDSTVSLDECTDDRTEAISATPITPTTTPTMFGDDETIAQVLLNMS
ncbi:hypothetical protein Tco_1488677 [Tanacetum coccineum]